MSPSLIGARLDAIRPALEEAAERFGTPLYVTDLAVLDELAADVEDAFGDVRELVPRGWAANVVSLGEWAAARRARMLDDAIALAGIGKSDYELRAAVAAAARGEPLLWVTLESIDEAARLAELWQGAHRASTMDMLLRLNPEHDASHLSEEAFWEAAGLPHHALCVTHTSVRALMLPPPGHPARLPLNRFLSDAQIAEAARPRGAASRGVIGLAC
jgi:diaminopimelate decarboxylase